MDRCILPAECGEGRSNVQQAFGKVDEQSLGEALADLENPHSWLRGYAVTALGRHEEWDSVPGLLRALEDADTRVRGTAALYLGSRQGPGVLDALLEHLYHDPSPHVQLMCSTYLDHWPDDPRVKAAYLYLLESTDTRRLTSACAGVKRLRITEAIPHLTRLLASLEYLQRKDACETLTALGVRGPKIAAVLDQLVEDPLTVRVEALAVGIAAVLRDECEDEEAPHVPTLREALEQARQPPAPVSAS